MKQFIVDRHTTPNTPTLEQVPTEKIPIYENRAAVTADLANLSVGQIVATKDTGDELAQPVDVVESGNLHAVSSNAVAEHSQCYKDGDWNIYTFGKKYIGICNRSEGANVACSTAYGSMFTSAVKSLALPQSVKTIQKVTGNIATTGGGIVFVTINDNRADVGVKTNLNFYYVSAKNFSANFSAVFMCSGDLN